MLLGDAQDRPDSDPGGPAPLDGSMPGIEVRGNGAIDSRTASVAGPGADRKPRLRPALGVHGTML